VATVWDGREAPRSRRERGGVNGVLPLKLFVDDVRTAPAGWETARTVPEAIAILEKEAVEEVSLDFMIGDRFSDNFTPVAHFIVTLPEEKRPRRVLVHTSSASGAQMLFAILKGHVKEIVRI